MSVKTEQVFVIKYQNSRIFGASDQNQIVLLFTAYFLVYKFSVELAFQRACLMFWCMKNNLSSATRT